MKIKPNDMSHLFITTKKMVVANVWVVIINRTMKKNSLKKMSKISVLENFLVNRKRLN